MTSYNREEMSEITRSKAVDEVMETVNVAGAAELDTLEQQEMNSFAQETAAEAEAAEQREMDEGEKLGYSSSYYEHMMASALENGNKIAYDNARRNWSEAKVRESTR